MTEQAKNSMKLYLGNSPKKIEMALRMQYEDVVDELMTHFHVNNISDLAVSLSRGF